MVAMATWFM